MKGIVLAGGLGTRLHPLTHATNKHLLPVYDRPMVFYPLQTLVNAGIRDVMIVTGGPHAGDFIRVLKNGEDLGLNKLNYGYQEGEGGIADALSMAESFVGGDSCVVILGDNIIADDISRPLTAFRELGGCHIFTKEVHDPERFGVVEYCTHCEEGEIADIIEKPADPPSNDAVIGLYMYDNTVFDKIRNLDPSARGELEVTDLNRMYLKEGNLTAHRINGTWIDCGTFNSLAKATQKFYNDKN
jgi:glucose-1-phosphate thymidylyltransferase|tara:strand:- start:4599 stop:5327 length:729 start_codon:yes stop_codon:yes gene_type:complete